MSLATEDGSLYDRLEQRAGLTVQGGSRTVQATHAPAAIARRLELRPHSPVAFIESVSWDGEKKPFHFFQTWLRTDRIRIEVQVTRVPRPQEPPAGTLAAASDEAVHGASESRGSDRSAARAEHTLSRDVSRAVQ